MQPKLVSGFNFLYAQKIGKYTIQNIFSLPYKRLMGMCSLMGLHFHGWIDYHRVAYLLGWGRTFSDFWGKVLFIFTASKHTRMFVLKVKSKVFFIQKVHT